MECAPPVPAGGQWQPAELPLSSHHSLPDPEEAAAGLQPPLLPPSPGHQAAPAGGALTLREQPQDTAARQVDSRD